MDRNNKIIVVRIAEGIGNQLFMYANSFSLCNRYNYKLLIDDTSGYFKKKNRVRSFQLNKFLVDFTIADNNYKFDNYYKDVKRKFLKKIDFFKQKKSFFIEKRDEEKRTFYNEATLDRYSNIIFLEGHFESESYFKKYSKEIKNNIKINTNYINLNNKYIDILKNSNSVSICVRQNRYSEGKTKNNNKSIEFTKQTISYINDAVKFVKKKIDNPKFFVWSNDFTNLRTFFDENEFTFIENQNNKSLNDFYLFQYCKHFILGPTSFHWWGAWLNESSNKICIRPKNINPSNNINFWPENWKSI